MPTEGTAAAALQRQQQRLVLGWSTAWLVGLGALGIVAATLNAELQHGTLDNDLALHATATYGLTWFDEEGTYHPEFLLDEAGNFDLGADIWVVEPGDPPIVHFRPEPASFAVDDLGSIAESVVTHQADLWQDGRDGDRRYRLHAIPMYDDDAVDVARGAIVVVGDLDSVTAAHAGFLTKLVLAVAVLGVLGVGVGVVLARVSVRPVARAFEERERFLAAAAHELRTPLATLRAVSESALEGDEPADVALRRVHAVTKDTADEVEELLIYARLDAGAATPVREPVRLDLLVEECLPERADVELDAEACVAEVDPQLLRVAIRNLLRNAVRHARGAAVRVRVTTTEIVVEDDGSGFPPRILELARGAFSFAPSRQGAGIGLATVKMIAELHGGGLVLANSVAGGAKATLRLAPA